MAGFCPPGALLGADPNSATLHTSPAEYFAPPGSPGHQFSRRPMRTSPAAAFYNSGRDERSPLEGLPPGPGRYPASRGGFDTLPVRTQMQMQTRFVVCKRPGPGR